MRNQFWVVIVSFVFELVC